MLKFHWPSQPGLPGAGLSTLLRTGLRLSWSEVIWTPRRPQRCLFFFTPSGTLLACTCSTLGRSKVAWSPSSLIQMTRRQNFLRIGRLKLFFLEKKCNVKTQSSAICKGWITPREILGNPGVKME